MQIICNNCGNDIDFLNHQSLVICQRCYTHLKIEEHDNRIFAITVEAETVNHSIFQKTEVIAKGFPNALYDLLHLEGEYKEIIEETNFYSLTQRSKSRPMLLRVFYRLFVMIIVGTLLFELNGSISIFYVLILLYSIFLGVIGYQELRKIWELWRFERYYFQEKERLFTNLEEIDLPQSIRDVIDSFSANHNGHLEIIKEFYYVNLFNSVRIKVGMPSISKGLRILSLSILIGLIALVFGINGHSWALLVAALAIAIIFFGFFVLGDSSECKRATKQNFTKKMAIMDKIRKLMR